MDLTNIKEVKDLLARHGFRFSRSLGQNFLIADWAPRRIADAARLDRTCGVVEIGPGVGCLTRELAARAGKVAAVELDRSLLPVLAETLAGCPNAEIIPGDAMKLDLSALVAGTLKGLSPHVCANLPYGITTPAITRLLESGLFRSVTVMIQREVARRVCAAPGTADYGAFTLLCQYYARCEPLFDVPPECFLPAPRVTSAVVRMEIRDTPPVDADRTSLFRVIRAAFAQRRKTLLNALSSACGGGRPKEELRRILLDCGLPEAVRGEILSLEQFAALTKRLGKM